MGRVFLSIGKKAWIRILRIAGSRLTAGEVFFSAMGL